MKRDYKLLTILMFTWFVIAFISNALGSLLLPIAKDFALENMKMVGFIPIFFFLAYGIMSIPSGLLIEKWGERQAFTAGFLLPLIGSLTFAFHPTYVTLLASCFIMGIGMTMLQTVLNPMQRIVGGEENYALVACLGQVMYGIASFSNTHITAYFISNLRTENYVENQNSLLDLLKGIIPEEYPWVAIYLLFAVLLFIMIIAINTRRLPKINATTKHEEAEKGAYKALFKSPQTWLFFLGILFYVSTEQGTSQFMKFFLEEYHGDVCTEAMRANILGHFWASMTVGCIIGLFLLRLFDSRYVLIGSGLLATFFVTLSLFAPFEIAQYSFPAIGFSISMVFGLVFSLALNSARSHHGTFAGILCSGVAGGAFGPFVVSAISDAFDLRTGMLFILIFTLYIASIGFWAKPLIKNKTVPLKDVFNFKK